MQEIARQQAEGMRAMSNEEMARRQLEAADRMRNAWPDALDCRELQNAYSNAWRGFLEQALHPAPLTRWQRLMRWLRK